ncbi:MAG: DNA-3-methyladenine glycosylase [Candidatus Parcubacteria bacterium]|nr:DNA-3-methyladenine glycosylase [Candidatus Parcubacteria bacterium]
MPAYRRLNPKFYQQNTFEFARDLLGKYLMRKQGKYTLIGKIVETEAYFGPNDLASHASRGKTARTQMMFEHAGLAYIYLIYGMYYCFNIVTEAKDFPAAILIRAVEPISGISQMQKNRHLNKKLIVPMPNAQCPIPNLTNGPAKLCQAFKIDKKLNGHNLITSKLLYLAENPKEKIKPSQIQSAKRVNIDYAGHYKHKLWRYYIKNNTFVSMK